jgi:hypothetical protein
LRRKRVGRTSTVVEAVGEDLVARRRGGGVDLTAVEAVDEAVAWTRRRWMWRGVEVVVWTRRWWRQSARIQQQSVRQWRGPDCNGGGAASRCTRMEEWARGVNPATVGEVVGDSSAWT